MKWREAYLKQARSDLAVFRWLNRPEIEYCHRLHYLQMMSEKLARGYFVSPEETEPPEPTHAGLVRMLQVIKGRRDICAMLGVDRNSFKEFIDSLLDFVLQVQSLAPAIARFTRPNPEYPWRPLGEENVRVPGEFDFQAFNPRSVQMAKLLNLLDDLISEFQLNDPYHL